MIYDTIPFENIPNKTTSHTNVFVNTSIQEVFTLNVAGSGYILKFMINPKTPSIIGRQKAAITNTMTTTNHSKPMLHVSLFRYMYAKQGNL